MPDLEPHEVREGPEPSGGGGLGRVESLLIHAPCLTGQRSLPMLSSHGPYSQTVVQCIIKPSNSTRKASFSLSYNLWKYERFTCPPRGRTFPFRPGNPLRPAACRRTLFPFRPISLPVVVAQPPLRAHQVMSPLPNRRPEFGRPHTHHLFGMLFRHHQLVHTAPALLT